MPARAEEESPIRRQLERNAGEFVKSFVHAFPVSVRTAW
jgi:hypothetical protein